MIRNRIYKRKFYIVDLPQGISGFPRPPISAIVTGEWLQKNRTNCNYATTKLDAIQTLKWKMADGHLPEFQPIGSLYEGLHFLRLNPYAYITPVKP